MEEYRGLRRSQQNYGGRAKPNVERSYSAEINKDLLDYKESLDDRFSYIEDPYVKWEKKRELVKKDANRINPNSSPEYLNRVYEVLNIDSSTNPVDFNRDEGFFGSLSRAGSIAARSAGTLVDTAQMKLADWSGDTKGVIDNQKQIDDSAIESAIINQFQRQSSGNQNKITQFLFDLSASAPIMAGVVLGGIGTGAVLSSVGVPFWLAGILGMGAADALSEMGFNYADVVSDPVVREKMEQALGGEGELNDATQEDIRLKVQEILMDEADTSAAKVGIANFINPLNWTPITGKFNKLMKVGSGRLGTIGRQAAGSAVREGIEEFGQSVGSQYTSSEAKMRAMRVAGVEGVLDPKDVSFTDKVDFNQAGYESLMGITVGYGMGGIGGYKSYNDWITGRQDATPTGQLKKNPGDPNFIGKAPLQLQTRRIVDQNEPSSFKSWYEKLEPGREKKIVDDELSAMSEGSYLMGEKSSPERISQRKSNAKELINLRDSGFDIPVPETETQVNEETDTQTDTQTDTTQGIKFSDPQSRMKYTEIIRKPEDQRSAKEKITLDILQKYPNDKFKDIRSVVNDLVKDQNTNVKDTSSPTVEPVKPNVEPVKPEAESTATTKSAEPDNVGLTEGILNKDQSRDEIVKAVNNYYRFDQPPLSRNDLNNLVLREIKNLGLKDKGGRTKKGKVRTDYDISKENREQIVDKILGRFGFTLYSDVASPVERPGTVLEQDVQENVVQEVFEPTPELQNTKTAQAVSNLGSTIQRIIKNKPKAKSFDKNNNVLPIKVQDADVSQFINRVVIVESPQSSKKREYVMIEGGPEAQSKIDREKAGLRKGGALKSRASTKIKAIQFKGIKNGKIIFNEVDGGVNQDLTVPDLPLRKVPVPQGLAENALRHLQTLEEKSFVNVREQEVGGVRINVAGSSYQTVYGKEELKESPQSKKVREVTQEISNIGNDIDDQISQQPQDDLSDPELTEKFEQLDKATQELNELLPEKDLNQETRVREGEPSTKERPPLNLLGRTQETINARIRNINKVFNENNKTLPPQEINRTLDEIEASSPGGIIFSDEDRAYMEPPAERAVLKVKGKKREIEQRLVMELGVDLNITDTELSNVLKRNGFDLIDRTGRNLKFNLSDVVPNVRGTKKFTDPILDPVTGADTEADMKVADKEYGEDLADSMTRVNAPPSELEPQLGEQVKTRKEEAKLEKKREEVAKEEDTRQADAIEENLPMMNWKRAARQKMANYNSTKKGKAGIPTTAAIEKLRGFLEGKANNLSDTELLEYMWANEGTKKNGGTNGTPNIIVVGGKNQNKVGINDIEVTLKDQDAPAVYQPQWTNVDAPYKKLANDFINEKPAPVKPIKKPVPRSKAKSETEEVAKPEEVVQPTEATGNNIITPEELETALGELDKKKGGKWLEVVTSPEKGYYQDVAAWDASGYSGSAGFTTQIKEDLPGSTRAPKGLTDLIRTRMTEWLVGRVQSEQDIDSLKAEMEERYWPILIMDNRKKVNEAIIAKGSTPIPTTILKKKSKINKTSPAPLTPAKETPLQQGFISENALSAEREVPVKKPTPPDVWYIDPKEVEDIFLMNAKSNQLSELESFMEQDFPYGFQVVRKGRKWFVLKEYGNTELTNEDGEINRIEVPKAIKEVLSRKGKDNFGKGKPIEQISYKLDREEVLNSGSEIYLSSPRKVNVKEELNEAHHDKDRIKYAGLSLFDETVVETFWVDKDGKHSDKDGNELKAFITFKNKELANQFIADIKSKSPDFERLESLHQEQIQNELVGKDISDQVSDLMNESANDTSLKYTGSTADIELSGSEEQYGVGYNPDEAAQVATDNEAKAKLTKEELIDRRIRDLARKEGTLKRLADPEQEGAKPVSNKVMNNVVGKFIEKFPGLADITILTDEKADFFKALYDPDNDRIYLVNNQHFSEQDILQSLWHEGVGHGGLRNIMSSQEFLELQERVETSFPERFNEELDLLNNDKDFNDNSSEEKRSIAAQEVIAHYADNLEGQSQSIIDTITSLLRDIYNKFAKALGIKELNLTEADMTSILLDTAEVLKFNKSNPRIDIITNFTSNNVDTSLRRRSSSFDRSGLPEEARESWDRMGMPEDETSTGSWWHDIRRSLVSSITDPYRNIKEDIGETEYMVTRLAKRSDGILATILRHSGIKVDRKNVKGVLVNEVTLDPKIKSFFEALKPLGTATERQRFFKWIAYHRANLLNKQGRESGFNEEEINMGLSYYNMGQIKDASTGIMVDRSVVYENTRRDVMAMNKAIVNMGIDMGLFNKEVANNFEMDFYVPFYRLFEEEIGESRKGKPVNYSKLTGQQSVKKLVGSSKRIGDPFNNLLHNWLHIIDASVKNDAAVTTLRSAVKIKNPMDASQMLAEKTTSSSPNTVRVIEGGKETFYDINNKLLYQSLASMGSETKFPGLKYLISAKGIFTQVITASPIFKFNNILRDTVSAAGTTDIGFNLIKNAYGGFKSLSKQQAQMLVSGGYIQFQHTRTDDKSYAETILGKELTSGYLLNNPETDETFLSALKKAKKMGQGVWDRYARFGDKLENANRSALFKSIIEQGKSQTEAAYASRDLMDFTLHGGSDWVKLITSLTPFANALIQGKYKLGRAIINNPKPVAIVAGLTLLAQLFEEMYYENDDEYQNRPEYDKDTYWWISIPGTDTKFKMAKPHEFSAVANMAWRSLQLAKEENPDYGKALVSGVKSIVSREFGIVPLPQAIKPMIELGINKNLFFDRTIEPKGSQGRSPSLRYGAYTSETLILASQILSYSPIDKLKLSPYQLEHLVNGYFGWMGELGLGVADMLTRTTGDFPERPARKLLDYPMARRMFKSSPLRNTKSNSVYYERLKELEQTVQDLNFARRLSDWENYNEIYDSNAEILKYHAFMRKRKRSINDFNNRINEVRNSKRMDAEEKEVRLDRLFQLRNSLINKTVKILTGNR